MSFQTDMYGICSPVPSYMTGLIGMKPIQGRGFLQKQYASMWRQKVLSGELTDDHSCVAVSIIGEPVLNIKLLVGKRIKYV